MTGDSAHSVIINSIKHLCRGSFICTVIYFILYPWYNIIYDKLSTYSFMNDTYIFTLLLSCTHMTFYWTINSFFLFCDKYKYLQQYKIPRTKSQLPSDELLYKTLTKAIFGQLIFEPLGIIFVLYPLFEYHGSKMRLSDDEKPTFVYVFSIFILSQFLMEWLFYFIHRSVHYRSLYGFIHKQHHEYKGSIGFAAEYAHPIEGLAANFYPTLVGCLHTGAHPLIFFVYLFWRLWETYEGHSGYAFYGTWPHKYFGLTFADTALFHDYHHSRNIGNYGGHIQDWLFGTDTGYQQWLIEWKKSNKKQ
eukprot:53005_1